MPQARRVHGRAVNVGRMPGAGVEEPEPGDPHEQALLRLAHTHGLVRLRVMQALMTFSELDLPAPAEILNRMIDVAERKHMERYGSLDEVAPEPSPRAHNPVVYYLRLDRLVKIGTSGNLRTRLPQLPFDTLLAVEWGGHALETKRHRQFAAQRHIGEWFKLDDQLLDHVDAVRTGFESDVGVDTEMWVHEQLAHGSSAVYL